MTSPRPRSPGSGPAQGALLEDYKLKTSYSAEHTNRIQTQFQVLITLQTALATALVFSETGGFSDAAPYIAVIQLCLSLAWLFVGHAGLRIARLLRQEVYSSGKAWAESVSLNDYRPVGDLAGANSVLVGEQRSAIRKFWLKRTAPRPVPVVGVLAPSGLIVFWLALAIYLFISR